uniref:Uncharacterized protein n=1 Tax=Paramoeba aestuarina TaxID=180227 RepID=A0A7S4NNF0_9EUKA|mmetsp:Transcript_21733/g.33773  ORF Transcript_21733/g.33773 Transcript_21733/m.33773 type:complete len:102 (+) Transcript_21733:57-362(+)
MKRFLEDVGERREEPTVSKKTGVVWRKEDEKEYKRGAVRGGVGIDEWVGCMEGYRERMSEFLEYYQEEATLIDDTELGVWKERMLQLMPEEREELVGGEGA